MPHKFKIFILFNVYRFSCGLSTAPVLDKVPVLTTRLTGTQKVQQSTNHDIYFSPVKKYMLCCLWILCSYIMLYYFSPSYRRLWRIFTITNGNHRSRQKSLLFRMFSLDYSLSFLWFLYTLNYLSISII